MAARTIHEAITDAIREALAETGGNRTHAAKLLGISLRGLRYRVNSIEELKEFRRPKYAKKKPCDPRAFRTE
jgi:DNA-binding NtrC family response regulator